jgi:pimeloyl-ACP methyl ester carboxylesterase
VSVFTGNPGPRPDVLAPELKCPVLVLWGAEDKWTPVDGTVARVFARLAQERPQQMKFVVLERCGHVPFDDATDDSVSAAVPFLQKVLH